MTTHFADDATLALIARLEAENNTLRMRASFPLPGPIDDTGWVLECLQDGRITVSKAREWLRDYILNGKKGPLPEGPFDEPSVWDRAERAEAENKELREECFRLAAGTCIVDGPDGLMADAARYRHLRNGNRRFDGARSNEDYLYGEELDAAIDAAMERKERE